MKKEKLSSANLYDVLDKREEEQIKKEIKSQKRKNVTNKVLSNSFEFFKVFALIAIIVGAFFLRYQYSEEISQGFDKFSNTITGVVDKSSSNASMKKAMNSDSAKKASDSKATTASAVPDITITGFVEKENGKHMIFKYDNKIFTLKEGDKFNGDTLKVKKIEGNTLEIEDIEGNVFSYSK